MDYTTYVAGDVESEAISLANAVRVNSAEQSPAIVAQVRFVSFAEKRN